MLYFNDVALGIIFVLVIILLIVLIVLGIKVFESIQKLNIIMDDLIIKLDKVENLFDVIDNTSTFLTKINERTLNFMLSILKRVKKFVSRRKDEIDEEK